MLVSGNGVNSSYWANYPSKTTMNSGENMTTTLKALENKQKTGRNLIAAHSWKEDMAWNKFLICLTLFT